jgi:putative ABC transport system permease protein
VAEASVEQGIAKTLRLKLGDTMRFDMGGLLVEAKITSLRKLEWGSMRANFFVIINPGRDGGRCTDHLDDRLPPAAQRRGAGQHAHARVPNLTVIDVSGIIRQLQEVLDQVVTAVEFLFLFTLASGVLVLYAALMGSTAERTREAGLLRALGATRRPAGAGAADRVRAGGRPVRPAGGERRGGAGLGAGRVPVQVPVAFRAAGVGWPGWRWARVRAGGGWLGLRNVLRQPPLQTLREA